MSLGIPPDQFGPTRSRNHPPESQPAASMDLAGKIHTHITNLPKIETSNIDGIRTLPKNRLFTAPACKFGDTAGFLNGKIEFNYSTEAIHSEWWKGREILQILKESGNRYSDDTVFSDMTKEVLKNATLRQASSKEIINALAEKYVTYTEDPLCRQRFHGRTMQRSLKALKNNPKNWENNTFPGGAGSGAAMRTMPIGEAFYKDKKKLIEVAIGSSYITHTNPQGFLGGFASALLTAFAYQNVPFGEWPQRLLKRLDEAKQVADQFVKYKEETGRDQYEEDWASFEHAWDQYVQWRFEEEGAFNFQTFQDTPSQRDFFYLQFALDKQGKYPGQDEAPLRDPVEQFSPNLWPGASGTSAPLLAYDAFMLAIQTVTPSFKEWAPSDLKTHLSQLPMKQQELLFESLLERACLHGGDSDSTGAIAFYLLAACVGIFAVPEKYLNCLERSFFLKE